MSRDITVYNQNSKLTLDKTKSLLKITNNILTKKTSKDLADYSWIDRLWRWADENNIPDLQWVENYLYKIGGYWEGIPRDKNKLLNLKSITLYDNYNLTELPEEICNLINLQELCISNTTLTELPKNIHNLKKLTKLDLQDNELTKLPKGVYRLTNLKELVLGNDGYGNNRITELSKEIGNLKNLTRLDLGSNSFTKLPKVIGNLKKLTELCLYENQLTELPKEIGNLNNLVRLTLMFNSFTKLPKEIGNLKNLTRLNLYSNQLTELPKKICNLTNLSELSLEGNPNLILTQEQKEWIRELQNNGYKFYINDDLLDRANCLEIPEIDINEDEIPF